MFYRHADFISSPFSSFASFKMSSKSVYQKSYDTCLTCFIRRAHCFVIGPHCERGLTFCIHLYGKSTWHTSNSHVTQLQELINLNMASKYSESTFRFTSIKNTKSYVAQVQDNVYPITFWLTLISNTVVNWGSQDINESDL